VEYQKALADIRKHSGGMRIEEIAEAVREKKIKYRKWKTENSKEAWMEYKKCRHKAKRVISSANEKETERMCKCSE